MVHDLYNDIYIWWSDYNAHITWCYATHMCRFAIYCTGQHSTMLCVHYSLTTKCEFYYKGREPYKQLSTQYYAVQHSPSFPFIYSCHYQMRCDVNIIFFSGFIVTVQLIYHEVVIIN